MFNIVIALSGRQTHRSRGYYKSPGSLLLGGHQSQSKKLIYRRFERDTRAPDFLLQKTGDIVIESKGGSHIMMLSNKHHDVNVFIGRESKGFRH